MNLKPIDFLVVEEFEKKIAGFFGAPYAVATDSCTSAIELCLRYKKAESIHCPKHTYLSIPMLAHKLGIRLTWWQDDQDWQDYYFLGYDIIDAAVLWKKNSYTRGSMMCVSFQHQKHLKIGRAGIILLDNEKAAIQLKKMSYDGRLSNLPWRDQDIDTLGYHYYMTPETAQLGLDKLQEAIDTPPKQWIYTDWPDLTKMKVFNESIINQIVRKTKSF